MIFRAINESKTKYWLTSAMLPENGPGSAAMHFGACDSPDGHHPLQPSFAAARLLEPGTPSLALTVLTVRPSGRPG